MPQETVAIAQAVSAIVKGVKDSTDGVPVVKGIFGAIDFALSSIKTFKSNRDEWRILANLLLRLCQDVNELIKNGSFDGVSNMKLLKDLEELHKITESINNEVARMQKRSPLVAVFQTYEDKAIIATFRQSLDDAWKRFILVHITTIGQGVGNINRALEELRVTSPPPEQPASIHVTKTCPLPTAVFTGRVGILSTMVSYFDPAAANCGPRIFVLTGLGGIGKSQIAYRFVELAQARNSNVRFSEVFFVDASSEESISSDMKSIAMAKKWGNTAEEGILWLTANQERWLLIFNNADDPKLNLRKHFPNASNGNILITSRNRESRVLSPSGHYQVAAMDESEAVSLLVQCMVITSNEGRDSPRQLAQALGYLPLLLVQAAAYILAAECSIAQYIELLKDRSTPVLEKYSEMAHRYDDYPGTAYAAWDASFQRLDSSARLLLQLCSHIHHDDIPAEIFRRASRSIIEDMPASPIPEQPSAGLDLLMNFLAHFRDGDQWNEQKFIEATRLIRQYSLLDVHLGDQSYSIHPIVHEWIRGTDGNPKVLATAAQYLCALALDGDESESGYRRRRRLLPHFSASVTSQESDMRDNLNMRLARTYFDKAGFEQATKLCEKVIRERKETLGLRNKYTGDALLLFADICLATGKFAEADRAGVECLEIFSDVLGPRHIVTAAAMSRLGGIKDRLQNDTEGLNLRGQALEITNQITGRDHPMAIEIAQEFSVSLVHHGRPEEAEPIARETAELASRVLGRAHPGTLKCMVSLAITLIDVGRVVEAEKIMVQLRLEFAALGLEQHPTSLFCMTHHARCLRGFGRLVEAEELGEKTLEKLRRILGEEHPSTINTLAGLSRTRFALGKYEDAEHLGLQVLEKRRRTHGDEHPYTACTMMGLAYTCIKLGKLGEAEKTLLDALGLLKANAGALRRFKEAAIGAMETLSKLFMESGRETEASELNEEVETLKASPA